MDNELARVVGSPVPDWQVPDVDAPTFEPATTRKDD